MTHLCVFVLVRMRQSRPLGWLGGVIHTAVEFAKMLTQGTNAVE